jgi:cysteine desulfurase/selenocysteine lyase
MCGPTGVGILWGRRDLLEAMPPYQGGGEMIDRVERDHSTWAALPHKFEAGTPDIAGAVGLGAAVDFLRELGVERIGEHERGILEYATGALEAMDDVRLIGTAPGKSAVVSFLLDGIHAHDVGTVLDHDGVAIRTGHHCAQPVMDFFGVPATARASFSVFNTREDVDALVRGLERTRKLLGGKS